MDAVGLSGQTIGMATVLTDPLNATRPSGLIGIQSRFIGFCAEWAMMIMACAGAAAFMAGLWLPDCGDGPTPRFDGVIPHAADPGAPRQAARSRAPLAGRPEPSREAGGDPSRKLGSGPLVLGGGGPDFAEAPVPATAVRAGRKIDLSRASGVISKALRGAKVQRGAAPVFLGESQRAPVLRGPARGRGLFSGETALPSAVGEGTVGFARTGAEGSREAGKSGAPDQLFLVRKLRTQYSLSAAHILAFWKSIRGDYGFVRQRSPTFAGDLKDLDRSLSKQLSPRMLSAWNKLGASGACVENKGECDEITREALGNCLALKPYFEDLDKRHDAAASRAANRAARVLNAAYSSKQEKESARATLDIIVAQREQVAHINSIFASVSEDLSDPALRTWMASGTDGYLARR